MRPLAIESLSTRAFRNLAAVDLELGQRFNVLSGDNGQGKTNVLEAVYVVATSRSFRTSRAVDLVESGRELASVRARVVEDGVAREQVVGMRPHGRSVRTDGKRPENLAAYAVRTPTVVFHPGVVALSMGSGAERRRLLDRVALYRTPGSLGDGEAYAKALRARQRVLESRGDTPADLQDWESLVVRHGLALGEARASAAERLRPAAERAFERIGQPGLPLRVSYVANAPGDAEAYRALLVRNRARDRARGSATVGPHRDELGLALAEVPVRGIASQGQHRAVVLALQLAEMEVIAEARGVRPILLLDDVSSELDRARTAALFAALREEPGQVLLTTTRPDLIETGALCRVEDRRDFTVVAGRVEAL
jgi:DNA replication and repair protein RecF